ncbi:hypothetical protein ACFWGL_12450 [Streptomyces sp. NPDC060286]|uniref:hypothetical protein n=1 Tax=unclassified Streptomyces TaxID=2593676 RepID=UPI0035DCB474
MERYELPVIGGPLDGMAVMTAQFTPLDIHPIRYPAQGGRYELIDSTQHGLALFWVTGEPTLVTV